MKQHTKIETALIVRRWNAQIEIADQVMQSYGWFDDASPYEILGRLLGAGHTELAESIRKTGTLLGYFPPACPDSHRECTADTMGGKTKSKYHILDGCLWFLKPHSALFWYTQRLCWLYVERPRLDLYKSKSVLTEDEAKKLFPKAF